MTPLLCYNIVNTILAKVNKNAQIVPTLHTSSLGFLHHPKPTIPVPYSGHSPSQSRLILRLPLNNSEVWLLI